MDDERSREERFDDALREWAARPPRLAPAAAARAVAARVAPRRSQPFRPAWALAAAAAVVLAVGSLVTVRALRQPAAPVAGGAVPAAPILGENQVLIWLDEETPLYMTFAAPGDGAARGGVS